MQPSSVDLYQGHFVEMSEDELRVPASSADVGMLPIPTETWIDILVIMGDAAKGEEHPADACDAKKQ